MSKVVTLLGLPGESEDIRATEYSALSMAFGFFGNLDRFLHGLRRLRCANAVSLSARLCGTTTVEYATIELHYTGD